MTQITQRINNRAERLGGSLLDFAVVCGGTLHLLARVIGSGVSGRWLASPAVINVVIRQIYFTGIQSLLWVCLVAVGVGALAVYYIVDFAQSIQDMSLISRLVPDLLLLEIAPLLVTTLLLSRSGVAVVTELGNMHVRGEDLTLASLGISVQEYLLWPRLLAFTLCGLILTFVFVAVALWLGGLMVSLDQHVGFVDFLLLVQQGTTLQVMALLIFKGVLFPMLAAMVLLDQGCRVGREPNLLPVHATRGVFGALMVILMSDTALAVMVALL